MLIHTGHIGAHLHVTVRHILQEPEILSLPGHFKEIGGSKASVSHRRHRIRHLHSVHIPEMIVESRLNSGYGLREVAFLVSVQCDSLSSHASAHTGHFHGLCRRRAHGKRHVAIVFQPYATDIVLIFQCNLSVLFLHVSRFIDSVKK